MLGRHDAPYYLERICKALRGQADLDRLTCWVTYRGVEYEAALVMDDEGNDVTLDTGAARQNLRDCREARRNSPVVASPLYHPDSGVCEGH